MLTRKQILVLNSKGYDIVFERKGKTYALKSSSLSNWDEEKKKKFRKETGLAFALVEDEWVFYNPNQYKIYNNTLKYISTCKKPEQPINCKNYVSVFGEWVGSFLDLSHWDVSNGESFKSMFYGCRRLQSLNLAGWNVSRGRDFSRMFYNCRCLQSLDLSGWNTSKGEEFESMFYGCERLKSINLAGWDVSDSYLGFMFFGCESLESLDLSKWDTSNCRNFSYMFSGCKSLQSLDLSSWSVDRERNCYYMFSNTGIAAINEKSSDELVELLRQGRWSEVKQGSLRKAKLF